MFSFQIPSTLSKCWWNRSLRFPPLENNSHIYTILISSTTKKIGPKPQSHPHPKNTPQVMDLSVGFPEIFAMYWYSGMPPHGDRHPRETQPILVMFCQNAWEISGKKKGEPFFFGGSLHNWFLDPEGEGPIAFPDLYGNGKALIRSSMIIFRWKKGQLWLELLK